MFLTTPTFLQLFAEERRQTLLNEASEQQALQGQQERGSFISSLVRLLHVRLPAPSRQHPLNP